MKRISPLTAGFARELRRARPYLEAALDRQDRHGYAWADVHRMLLAGQCHLWSGNQSAAVTHIQPHPQGRVCVIWLAGGDLTELMDTIQSPENTEWAASLGCRAIEVHGRKGWEKVLKDSGFEPRAVTFVKLLEK